MPDGIATWINKFFSVCHSIMRAWPAAYQGNWRNVGGRIWNRESSSSNSNHHLRAALFPAAPQLSRAESKTEAGTASVPWSHTQPLCGENSRLAQGRKGLVNTEMGLLQGLEVGWSLCTWANSHILIWDELLLWSWKANHPILCPKLSRQLLFHTIHRDTGNILP